MDKKGKVKASASKTRIQKGQKPPAFGAEMRDQEFSLKPDEILLNNGSWGTLPNAVMDAYIQGIRDTESFPDWWYGSNRTELWDQNLAAIATALGADFANIQFVENISRGVSNVLKSFLFPDGGTILGCTWNYYSVKKCAQYMSDINESVDYVEIDYPTPLDKDTLMNTFRAALDANPNTKIVLFDQISSSPTAMFPVHEMAQECRNRGVLSLVDGAHVPGHLDLNIESINCDFYVANLNKWMLSPKGASVMWVAPPYQAQVRSAVQATSYLADWPGDFFHQGTRYDCIYTCQLEVLDFMEWIGGMSAITAYCRGLVDTAAAELVQSWGTQTFPVSAELDTPFMRGLQVPDLPNYPKDSLGATLLSLTLSNRYKITVRTSTYDGEIWIRISGHVYVTMEDMLKLKDAILELMDEEKQASGTQDKAAKGKTVMPASAKGKK